MVDTRLASALDAIGLTGPLTARDIGNLQRVVFVTGMADTQGIANAGMLPAVKLVEVLGSNWKARLRKTEGLRYENAEALFATGSAQPQPGVVFDTVQLAELKEQKLREEYEEKKSRAGICSL